MRPYVYTLPNVGEAAREMRRIAMHNPVWAAHMSEDGYQRIFVESAKADRAVFLYIPGQGSMFFTWTRAQGMDSLDILSGNIPTPEQWRGETGALYIGDICYIPEVSSIKAARAMKWALTHLEIAEPGEKVLYIRQNPDLEPRIGWIVA